jgi:hypothetical protein
VAYTYVSSSRWPASTTGNTGNPVTAVYSCSAANIVVLSIFGITTNAFRTGGPPIYGGVTMSAVHSASVTETSVQMYYLIDPPLGLQTVTAPNGAGLEIYFCFTNATIGAGSSSLYLTSSKYAATVANIALTMSLAGQVAAQPTPGGVWYVGAMGSGASTGPTVSNRRVIGSQDTGAEGWICAVHSSSLAAVTNFDFTVASDDAEIVMGAWGEVKNAEGGGPPRLAYTMIVVDDSDDIY